MAEEKDKNATGPRRLTQDEVEHEEWRARKQKEVQAQYELDPIDNRMVQLMVDYPEIRRTRLAQILGLKKPSLYYRLKKPSVIRALADFQKQGTELLKDVQKAAVRRVRRLVHSGDEKIALDACKLVLMPIFNQATLNVQSVEEKIFRVEFGESGSVYTTEVKSQEKQSRMTPLDIVKMAEAQDIALDKALENAKLTDEKSPKEQG